MSLIATMANHQHDFVVFSDDWGMHPSSCQHLFNSLGHNHRVLWVNTIGMRAPKADRFTMGRALQKFRQWGAPLRQVSDNFFVYSPAMLPAAGGATGQLNCRWVAQRLRRVLWRCGMSRPILFASVPTAADYVDQLNERALVYYLTDDYRQWPGANAEAIASQDQMLTRRANLLLPVSDALAAGRHTDGLIQLLPHAVDLSHFAQVDQPLPEPAELAGMPHPRLCFFGLIYEKLNLDMLSRLARENPEKQLVLIGPVKTDVSALASLPNVHLLGPRPYADLPRYLKHMDVLLMPYVLDEQIRQSSPLKLRECLATGKPTVAVDVPDLRRYAGLIHLAGSEDAYLAACRTACQMGGPAVATMRAAVANDTWQARAEQVERALHEALGSHARPTIAPPSLRVEECTDGATWDAYVTSHSQGNVWLRWGWSETMRSAYGLQCHYLLARRGTQVVGAVPLALQASRPFGRHLVSLPWLDHAGILADDAQAEDRLLEAAKSLAKKLDADLILRQLAPGRAEHVRIDKVAMVRDLPVSAEQLWDQFNCKVRNQVRKGQKAGLTTEWAGPEKLGEFYAVYSTNMRDLGSPPHSLEFLREVMHRFEGTARLLLVRHDERVIAAAMVMADPTTWQVPWASSLRDFNHLCPSHVMYWAILSAACGQTPRFCFGRSSRGSGTYNFKSQWGAVEQQLYWHTYLSDAPASVSDQPGRLISLVQRAWQRIPTSLARSLGPHIIKHVA